MWPDEETPVKSPDASPWTFMQLSCEIDHYEDVIQAH